MTTSPKPDQSWTTASTAKEEAPMVLDAAHLDARLNRLRAAIDSCPTEVPASLALPARTSLEEVGERLVLGVDHTVVALLGGTGSGKSSLFNALSGLQFADVGARRPTTSESAACTWGDDAVALLDFLGVNDERRIRRESLLDADDEDELAGLVLLDVPDYDSVTTEHALQVDRLVPLADVLVWVVDPQKYADAALHEGYLRGLGARQEDMLLLVNQVDTLPPGGQERFLRDIRSLLDSDGLHEVRVIPVSAVRGDNLTEVRDILIERVSRESNAARTASAELDAICLRLRPAAAAHPVGTSPEHEAAAVEALIHASGARAVEASIREGLARPLPRALARPETPSRPAVTAIRTTWMRRTTEGLPAAWLSSVDAEVMSPETLAAQTAEAVGSIRLPGHRSPIIELGWWGGLVATLLGLAWGGLMIAQGGNFLLPIALLVLGALLFLWSGARRIARAEQEANDYADRVRERLAVVAARGLTTPAQGVLARHRELREALRV